MVFRLLVGILGTICLLAAMVAIKAPAMWIPTVINIAVTLTVALWLRSTCLVVANGLITYRSLLVHTRLLVSEVAGARFVMGFSGLQPFQRVVFRMREGKSEVIVNAGLFEPGMIRQWVERLNLTLNK